MFQQKVDRHFYSKSVETDKFQVGDLIVHDIYLKSGALVAKAGIKINEKLLLKLKSLNRRLVTLDRSKVYKYAVEASQRLMIKATNGRNIAKEEVEELIAPFLQEVYGNGNTVNLLLELENRDEYTFQHAVNVGIISMFIGKWNNFKFKEVEKIALAGVLHDIGKSKIPLEILNKPGSLNIEEFEIMKKHAILGLDILQKSGGYDGEILQGVFQHHEREGGQGYPLGLKGNDIHPYAKIIAIADIYHAMTSDRVYKDKVSPFEALDHLKKNIVSLDSAIVLNFVSRMLDYLIGCRVLLNNGLVGKVIYIDKNNIINPTIQLDEGAEIINLAEDHQIKIAKVI